MPVEAVAGVGLAALFDLNMSPIFENGFVGEADGEAEATGVLDAPGLGDAVTVDFLRVCRGAGEEEGDGDAAAFAEDGALLDFLCVRCFAGEAEAEGVAVGAGDAACAKDTHATAVTKAIERRLRCIISR